MLIRCSPWFICNHGMVGLQCGSFNSVNGNDFGQIVQCNYFFCRKSRRTTHRLPTAKTLSQIHIFHLMFLCSILNWFAINQPKAIEKSRYNAATNHTSFAKVYRKSINFERQKLFVFVDAGRYRKIPNNTYLCLRSFAINVRATLHAIFHNADDGNAIYLTRKFKQIMIFYQFRFTFSFIHFVRMQQMMSQHRLPKIYKKII